MATQGNLVLNEGIPEIKDAFVVMVKTEWNAHIIDALEAGCKAVLDANGVQCATVVVPGAFEVPFGIRSYHKQALRKPDAYVALATIIRGDTPHFEYVCQGITNGIVQLNLLLEVPVIFGVLTVENEQQAKERIGGVHGHKGGEAGVTAIKMIAFNRSLR